MNIKQIALLYLLCSAFITTATAQKYKFEIGTEGGLVYTKYKIKDPQKNLQNVPCQSGIGGINFRINTQKQKWFYEIAFLAMEYTDGLKLKQQNSWFTSNSDAVIMFSLRAGYNFKLDKNFSIIPLIGLAPVIKTLNQDGGEGYYEEGNSSFNSLYHYTRIEIDKNIFMLLQGGIGIEYRFAKKLKFSAAFNYYQGFTNNAIYDINYQINTDPVQTANMYGKGTFVNYQAGLKFLFCRQK
ncbi:MAG TPA: outer membrane beta-barrel protein [Chitinophagaceae bacterium]|nr:autotransporter outer membrane beta-barrel domain-containing protein [Chitinophagaceae bacterium]MCC6634882.1 outer membrane beta-barrel protein [Chitinophagaceae bacterium]HNF28711.1 outer membrane beta-barrel protein [Chitinophagaceae bacterium]HNM34335.1 outer membrane beta-barrel protein [Chitinophagaceae bacterium]HNN31348.1 outer membrane beta-barrel protein [Chitinophagaceae bacterium]